MLWFIFSKKEANKKKKSNESTPKPLVSTGVLGIKSETLLFTVHMMFALHLKDLASNHTY